MILCYLQGRWCEGDRCLAPDQRVSTLWQATIWGRTTSHDSETMAWVVPTDHSRDQEVEEAAPVSKPIGSSSNCFTEEKPLFPHGVTDPRMCVPLELNHIDEDKVPYTINRYLRDYQREGVRFIYNHYVHSKGCILGDDMGLGKTVQVKSTSDVILLSELLSLLYFLCDCLSCSCTVLDYCLPCCCTA